MPLFYFLFARFDAASAVVKSPDMGDEFWVISGGRSRLLKSVSEVELMNRGRYFRPVKAMPMPRFSHCLIAVNNTHLVALGNSSTITVCDKTIAKYI